MSDRWALLPDFLQGWLGSLATEGRVGRTEALPGVTPSPEWTAALLPLTGVTVLPAWSVSPSPDLLS